MIHGLVKWLPFGFVCALLFGCVAPQTVKDASAQHTRNLAALESAVKAHQARIDKYYDDLIDLQRQASVASAAQAKLDEFVAKAALQAPHDAVGDSTSTNFIRWGAELTDEIRRASKEFDLRLAGTEGLAPASDPSATIAITLASIKKKLHGSLDVLLAQVAVMKASHAIIDDYVTTDATIDGAAIGKSLANGAAADPANLTEISKLFGVTSEGDQ